MTIFIIILSVIIILSIVSGLSAVISLFFNNLEKFEENTFILSTHNSMYNNLGDSISDIFFNKLSNKKFKNVNFAYKNTSYLTIGSILIKCKSNNIVYGSGFISENDNLGSPDNSEWKYENKVYEIPKKILSVRGPKTRNKLLKMGIDCPENYGDPLIILPLIYNNENININCKIGLIPHFQDINNEKFKWLNNDIKKQKIKTKIIDIKTKDYQKFINEIKECEYIISSSLHGVIISLVYGKKVILTNFSKLIGDTFKFYDFFESLGIKYNILEYNDKNLLNNTIKYDKDNLIKIGKDIINTCPFLDDNVKNTLSNNWVKYIKNL